MTAEEIELKKMLLSPPGDTIQETIDEIGMSQAELAERMGRPKEKINPLIKGKEPLTADTAFRLEKVLGIEAGFWLNREREYRQELYTLGQEEFLLQCIDWLNSFPINEMKKQGWLPNTKDKATLVNETLRFYGVASPQEWETIYVKEEVSVAFRISLANTNSPHALSAWLRKGEIDATKLNLPEYNKVKFKRALLDIKDLVSQFPVNYAELLQLKCAECGVAVVYVPNLPKAPVSGASRWFHGKPIIQLSGRYKTDDHFWFTFYHEAAHILLHGKKDIFLENVKGTPQDQQKENEANAFAAETLLSEKHFQQILNYQTWTRELFISLANKFNTSPGVIIGRLQHLELVDWRVGNDLRHRVDLFQNSKTRNESLTKTKDALNIKAQLDTIAKLKDGWFEGKGKAFDPSNLEKLFQQFQRCYTVIINPYLYPMPDGSISAEWENEAVDISLEIDLNDFSGVYHVLSKHDQSDTEQTLDLTSAKDWDVLNHQILAAFS